MFEYAKSSEVTEYLLWSPHSSRLITKKYLRSVQSLYRKGDMNDWAIVYKDNNKMIGTCGFANLDYNNRKGEVGYGLNKQYWGKGIAAEALQAVLRYGFSELKLERIEARYMEGNINSSRVMEKCGMKYEGMNRSSMFVKGEFKNIGTYSILKDEFTELI